MKSFFESGKVRKGFWIVGGIAVVLFIFALGMAVGYRRALFASHFDENYYENFYGRPAGFFSETMPMNAHGVVGMVIDVASGTLSVKDSENDETSVAVLPSTSIRKMNQTIVEGSIMVGDEVTVIGWPNAQGQIQAQFIRVFSTSSSAPQATGFH